ncbi:MAG: hypothetical protein O2955_15960 [Planctomycetota bacterium]|nr:hypothetical protein [Planctomycetota bacterium]MDA1214011.1 hypothetical protein [Planctomycetota bacterium]
MKVLLTEGSSTSARQTIYALGKLKATIDICDPQRYGLGRFSRFVRTWYRCPSYTAEPAAYVHFLFDRLRSEDYDVLLPVHDQVFLLSRYRDRLGQHVGVALPEASAVERLQSKAEFKRLLDVLALPHPSTTIVSHPDELLSHSQFPCYVKLAYSTAGRGVWHIERAEEMRAIADLLKSTWGSDSHREILIQQPACGTFCVIQAVFRHGLLVASHCYRSRAQGVGGSAHAREGVSHPIVVDDVSRLGNHLNWHGALHVEYFVDEVSGRHEYIEANPRIGETMNATLSGLNLCEFLLDISLGKSTSPVASRTGVRTHSLLMSLIGAAERGASRCALANEFLKSCFGKGVYRHSSDELVRLFDDPYCLIPAVAVTGQLFFQPRCAGRMIAQAVDNYGLTAAAVDRIRQLPHNELA